MLKDLHTYHLSHAALKGIEGQNLKDVIDVWHIQFQKGTPGSSDF